MPVLLSTTPPGLPDAAHSTNLRNAPKATFAMFYYDSPVAARIYDLQHEGDPVLEDERDFFLDRIAEAGGPALDLGCGTGRILLPALTEGHDVWGCDYSTAFLDRLLEKARAGDLADEAPRRIWCGDITRPLARPGHFALAFAAFRTFDHLTGPEDRLNFLKAVRGLLAPGGRLLLSVANPDPEDMGVASGEKVLVRDDIQDPDTGETIVWWGATQYEPETNLIQESAQYDFVDEEGEIVRSYYFPFEMIWTPADEMKSLARRSGWEIAKTWGGFADEDFEIGTGDAVWELRVDSRLK